jgi:hypothetical protein
MQFRKEARETEAGITEEGCVLKEAHDFSRREYHLVNQYFRISLMEFPMPSGNPKLI